MCKRERERMCVCVCVYACVRACDRERLTGSVGSNCKNIWIIQL